MRAFLTSLFVSLTVFVFGQALNGSTSNVDLPTNTNVRSARTASGIHTVQVGDALQLVAWNTGKSHTWAFDGGTGDATAKSPSVTWATPGVKNITYNGEVIPRMVVVYPDLSTADQVFDLSTDGDTLDLSARSAGDVVHLTGTFSGNRFVIRNGTGSAGNPIYVTNATGEKVTFNATSAEWGLATINCDHLSFVGVNDTKYGFVVNGKGIIPYGENNFVEFAGFHMVSPVSMGWLYKNDDLPRTNTSYEGITIHDVLVEDAAFEGIYFGRYTYDWEGNVYAEPYGHTMKHSKIYRCVTRNCGWDGIQLGSADQGAEVHDNLVVNCGRANTSNQNFGITINSGFVGSVFYNTVVHNQGGGAIQVFPYGNSTLSNNYFYAASVDNPVFVRTTPNFCPPAGTSPPDCYTHTLTNLTFTFSDNIVTGKNEAIYLLHSNTTDNGYTPNTPILIDQLTITDNLINGTDTYRQVGGEPNNLTETGNVVQ